jgi:hypothetical protein
MANFDTDTDSDHHQHTEPRQDRQSQSNNGARSSGEQHPSFERGSVTSDGGGRVSFSSSIQPYIAEGTLVGTYWEGRDLSRRPVQRSHLSSSIHTGLPPIAQVINVQTALLPSINLPLPSEHRRPTWLLWRSNDPTLTTPLHLKNPLPHNQSKRSTV